MNIKRCEGNKAQSAAGRANLTHRLLGGPLSRSMMLSSIVVPHAIFPQTASG